MPRYDFTVQVSKSVPDSTELELAGPEEARSMAIAEASEMLRDHQSKATWPSPDWWVCVTDEEGRTVCELRIEGTC